MACALPEVEWLEYSFQNFDASVDQPIVPVDGWIAAPNRPGHGLVLAESARKELARAEVLPRELVGAPTVDPQASIAPDGDGRQAVVSPPRVPSLVHRVPSSKRPVSSPGNTTASPSMVRSSGARPAFRPKLDSGESSARQAARHHERRAVSAANRLPLHLARYSRPLSRP